MKWFVIMLLVIMCICSWIIFAKLGITFFRQVIYKAHFKGKWYTKVYFWLTISPLSPAVTILSMIGVICILFYEQIRDFIKRHYQAIT